MPPCKKGFYSLLYLALNQLSCRIVLLFNKGQNRSIFSEACIILFFAVWFWLQTKCGHSCPHQEERTVMVEGLLLCKAALHCLLSILILEKKNNLIIQEYINPYVVCYLALISFSSSHFVRRTMVGLEKNGPETYPALL